MWRRCLGCLAQIVSLSILAGCGGAPAVKIPDTVPFKGKVTLDGQPFTNATVTFLPLTTDAKGHSATGVTNDKGEYELKITVGDVTKPGVVPGEYRVTIGRIGGPADPSKPIVEGPRVVVPERYTNPMSTELKATVNSTGGSQDFDLKSQ